MTQVCQTAALLHLGLHQRSCCLAGKKTETNKSMCRVWQSPLSVRQLNHFSFSSCEKRKFGRMRGQRKEQRDRPLFPGPDV